LHEGLLINFFFVQRSIVENRAQAANPLVCIDHSMGCMKE
jgi:hypothetical protein